MGDPKDPMQDFWKERSEARNPARRLTLIEFLILCALFMGALLSWLSWLFPFRLG